MSTVIWRGLEVTGTATYDRGQPYPSYSCGGVPSNEELDVREVRVRDAAEAALYWDALFSGEEPRGAAVSDDAWNQILDGGGVGELFDALLEAERDAD